MWLQVCDCLCGTALHFITLAQFTYSFYCWWTVGSFPVLAIINSIGHLITEPPLTLKRGMELLDSRVCVSSTLPVNATPSSREVGPNHPPTSCLPLGSRDTLCLVSQHYFHLQSLNHMSLLHVPPAPWRARWGAWEPSSLLLCIFREHNSRVLKIQWENCQFSKNNPWDNMMSFI